jgi:serine/threonine-protein kinase
MGVPGRIGGIQPFAELFEGATTVVYKGYEQALDRYVLLKVLKPAFSGDDDLAHRFEAEARLLAKVQHPNVVSIYTYGRAEGRLYLATEFVEGFSLRALIGRGSLPYPLVLYILHAAAEGLQAIHDRGILHRDIKPENILVGHEGHVKLADFGLASLVGDAGAEVRGTLAYLAPEQVLGAPPTVSSDLFSLGATCYEMLVGQPAFSGRDASGYLDAVLHHDPLPFLASDAGLPPPILRLTARLMAKRPEDRYAGVAALLTDLEAARHAVGHACDASGLAVFLRDPTAFRSFRQRCRPTRRSPCRFRRRRLLRRKASRRAPRALRGAQRRRRNVSAT